MATKTVTLSDLTGTVIEDDDHISIVVRTHPTLDGMVRLDASDDELGKLKGSKDDYVVLDVHRAGGTESMVVALKDFDALFTGDPQEHLMDAEPYQDEAAPRRRGPGRPRGSSTRSTGGGAKARRDPEQLKAIRTWARENGYPDLGDRGRIPADAEAAYEAAHK